MSRRPRELTQRWERELEEQRQCIARLQEERRQIADALDRRGLFLFGHIDGTFTVNDK